MTTRQELMKKAQLAAAPIPHSWLAAYARSRGFSDKAWSTASEDELLDIIAWTKRVLTNPLLEPLSY